MKVIQVRGTSGSGKSTVIRRVMESFTWEGIHSLGRKRPLWYKAVEYPWAIVGHYDSQCGGGDTIGSAKAIYELVRELEESVQPTLEVILAEGLLLSEDVKWTSQLQDVKVFFLNTSLERCLAQIRSRRAEAGNEKLLNEVNTTNRVGVIERARGKLESLGVSCRRCSSVQCVELILRELRLHAQWKEVQNGPRSSLDAR